MSAVHFREPCDSDGLRHVHQSQCVVTARRCVRARRLPLLTRCDAWCVCSSASGCVWRSCRWLDHCGCVSADAEPEPTAAAAQPAVVIGPLGTAFAEECSRNIEASVKVRGSGDDLVRNDVVTLESLHPHPVSVSFQGVVHLKGATALRVVVDSRTAVRHVPAVLLPRVRSLWHVLAADHVTLLSSCKAACVVS